MPSTHDPTAIPTAPVPVRPIEETSLANAPQTVRLQAGSPTIDTTQTVRALIPLEPPGDETSPWFAIQLMLSEQPIDAQKVPNLDIFEEYRLYALKVVEQGKTIHALRLGFFSSEIAAEAVSSYLTEHFATPAIKRVISAERDRFADNRVVAGKDIGATHTHAVIEIVAPLPLPEQYGAETLCAERNDPLRPGLRSGIG